MKNGMSDEDYYKICLRICAAYPCKGHKKNLPKRIVAHPLCIEDCIASEPSYEDFEYEAKKIKIHKTKSYIKENDFYSLIKKPCHYCGVSPSHGLDRKINKLGYIKKNVTPCCSQCNYMKKKMSENEFVDKILNVCETIIYS
tara:strand:- start:2246 stop:2671 length:426 start_codon:yes stop_codon:yes gene_type:complete